MRLRHTALIIAIVLLWPLPTLAAQRLPTLLPVAGSQTSGSSTPPGGAYPLDLIIEADTYAPYFYGGRAEPVAGNRARAIAILPPEAKAASFQWQIGDQRLVTAGPSASFTWPGFSRELQISVAASDSAGRLLGSAIETVPASAPRIVFYETNNLRGIYRIAVRDPLILIGSEVSVRAEPYFLGVQNLLQGASGRWSVPGAAMVPGNDWRAVSFTRSDGDTPLETTATFSVQNRGNPAEAASKSFKLSL